MNTLKKCSIHVTKSILNFMNNLNNNHTQYALCPNNINEHSTERIMIPFDVYKYPHKNGTIKRKLQETIPFIYFGSFNRKLGKKITLSNATFVPQVTFGCKLNGIKQFMLGQKLSRQYKYDNLLPLDKIITVIITQCFDKQSVIDKKYRESIENYIFLVFCI